MLDVSRVGYHLVVIRSDWLETLASNMDFQELLISFVLAIGSADVCLGHRRRVHSVIWMTSMLVSVP